MKIELEIAKNLRNSINDICWFTSTTTSNAGDEVKKKPLASIL